ncbi:uncharacterized protein A4U43_C05F10280 [Asparagus officinalis]|uniref:Replication factor A C-terminal domain-containing protein n=1 Tax=Asparagus officinalis TaxID=4686 RepID=A0A5P1EUC5_ASPOF|nr:uncharacterized protein A4U43_C05F10280 [Asparagus officinalis]
MESNDEDPNTNCPEVINDAMLGVCNTRQCTSITQSSAENVNLICNTSGTRYTQLSCGMTPTQASDPGSYVAEATLTQEVEQRFIGNNTVSSSSASRVYINIDDPKVKDLSQSYKITLEVEDYSVVSTITLFNKEAEKLFKVSANEIAKNLVKDVFAQQNSDIISLTEEGPPTTPLIAPISNSVLKNTTNVVIKPKIEKAVNNNFVVNNSIEVEEKTGSIEKLKLPMQEANKKRRTNRSSGKEN